MSTIIDYSRTQWAVGQGLFHSGTVTLGDATVTYIFDCGSFDDAALQRELAEFARRTRDPIDILFLSHFHHDHVSGLGELFTSHTVRKVVIPLVPAAERLIVLAQALASERGPALPDWYDDLVVDPAATLTGLGGETEVVPVPPVAGLDEDDDEDEEGQADVQDETDGPAAPEDHPPGAGPGDYSHSPTLAVAARSVLRGSQGGTTEAVWVWDTLVTDFASRRRDQFLTELATRLGLTRTELDALLGSDAGVRDVVKDHRADLVAAYAATFPDLNLTSLLLYSGPAPERRLRGRTYRTRTRTERGELHAWALRPAWFGTGDQRMGARRVAETARHYGAQLARVGSLALPHHGSRGSFHPRLLTVFGPDRPICSASVGTANAYGHPSTAVLQQVSSHGNHVVLTTEEQTSRWSESGRVYL